MTSPNLRTIILSEADHRLLTRMIESGRVDPREQDHLAALEAELSRGQIVPPADIPPDVITLNSTVRLRDLNSGKAVTYTLVDPARADITEGRISVLAPVGTAILGYREGDTIEWSVPSGLKRLKVEEILYQPERAGAFER